jgi:hypothetical protein
VAWAYSPTDVWAYGGADLHWSGSSWTEQPGVSGVVTGVWALSKSDVWATATGYAAHNDGTGWKFWTSTQATCSPRCLPAEVATYISLTSVWASGPSDVWIGAEDGNYGGILLHWTGGTTWSIQATGTGAIRSVWGSGPNDVWAVGGAQPFQTNGLEGVLHWDGVKWTSVSLGKIVGWEQMRGYAANDIWMVGNAEAGIVAHYDGSAWHMSPTGFPRMTAIWGPAAGEIWVSGWRGGLLRHLY